MDQQMKTDEMFALIEDHPTYMVSNYGKVLNIKRGRFLTPYVISKGYMGVSLTTNGVKTTAKVHRLVAQAFVFNPKQKPQVNHRDGDKRNNAAINLEWCTNQENQIHAVETGLSPTREFCLVAPNGTRYTGTNVSDFARTHGLNRAHLSKVVTGERAQSQGWVRGY